MINGVIDIILDVIEYRGWKKNNKNITGSWNFKILRCVFHDVLYKAYACRCNIFGAQVFAINQRFLKTHSSFSYIRTYIGIFVMYSYTKAMYNIVI